MKPVVVSRKVHAPLDRVFKTISEPSRFQEAVPHITNIEFLSDVKSGVGTRFNETRLMGRRESTVELEVTEFVENQSVRMISDAGGTIWDTVFTVVEESDHVALRLRMEIKPHSLLARFATPFIWRMVAKGIETDMDIIKEYCESSSKRAG